MTNATTELKTQTFSPSKLVNVWWRGNLDYWNGVINRRATLPEVWLDGLRWAYLMNRRRTPTWATPNVVVLENAFARLRDFSPAAQSGQVPTLVFPPQAGHHSCIVDYSPEQSQIRMIQDSGLTSVYSLDWIGATQATKDTSVDDYLRFIDAAVEHIGGKANLIGDCQGGWLATVYAALYPDKVNTLTVAGAPIDYHIGNPQVVQAMKYSAPFGNLALFKALVASGGGVLRGQYMLQAFKLMQPTNELERQLALAANLHDPDFVANYHRFEDWFKFTQDIPGNFYLWTVEHLFRNNGLIKGEVEIGGRLVDLSQIDCPLFLLGGEIDHITLPEQCLALGDYVSTPQTSITRHIAPGGHIGLFIGKKSLKDYWSKMMAQVYRLSV